MLIVNRLDEANCIHEAVHDGALMISVTVAEVTRTHIAAALVSWVAS